MTSVLPAEDLFQDGVIKTLLSSNKNWVQCVTGFHPNYFRESAQGQQPLVLWIGCSDSRVPDGVLTASPPGQIFTHRNIANQFPIGDTSAQSVLGFAVNSLGVTHIMVVGHTKCGGVDAALKNAQSGQPPPTGTPLEKWLVPLTQRIIDLHIPPGTPQDEAILIATKENVKMQIENISKSIMVDRYIHIHGWLYELETGLLKNFPFA